MPKVEVFEEHIGRYEAWFQRHRPAYEAEVRALQTLFPRGRRSLEIGVGTGRFAAPLGIGLGVEPSRVLGRLAKDRGIQVLAGVAEALPIKASALDAALMVTTICFVDDVALSLREAWRVLRPGGALVIGFVDRESPLGERYEREKAFGVFYREANFYSARELASLMRDTGFSDLAFSQTIFRPLGEVTDQEPVKEGYGEGSFVVVRGIKGSQGP